MKDQLFELLAARSTREKKSLQDRISAIRHEMQAAGVFASSMHVNAVIRVCADYLDNFIVGALSDFKRLVDISTNKHDDSFLEEARRHFFEGVSATKGDVRSILELSVGGIAKKLSNKGLQQFTLFDESWEAALRNANVEIDVYYSELKAKRAARGLHRFLNNQWLITLAGGLLVAFATWWFGWQ